MSRWRIIVVGKAEPISVEAKNAEQALKKAKIKPPEDWNVTTLARTRTILVTPPIKLG